MRRLRVRAAISADRAAHAGSCGLPPLFPRDRLRSTCHEKGAVGHMSELLESFMSLMATFAVRMSALRSAEAASACSGYRANTWGGRKSSALSAGTARGGGHQANDQAHGPELLRGSAALKG